MLRPWQVAMSAPWLNHVVYRLYLSLRLMSLLRTFPSWWGYTVVPIQKVLAFVCSCLDIEKKLPISLLCSCTNGCCDHSAQLLWLVPPKGISAVVPYPEWWEVRTGWWRSTEIQSNMCVVFSRSQCTSDDLGDSVPTICCIITKHISPYVFSCNKKEVFTKLISRKWGA